MLERSAVLKFAPKMRRYVHHAYDYTWEGVKRLQHPFICVFGLSSRCACPRDTVLAYCTLVQFLLTDANALVKFRLPKNAMSARGRGN